MRIVLLLKVFALLLASIFELPDLKGQSNISAGTIDCSYVTFDSLKSTPRSQRNWNELLSLLTRYYSADSLNPNIAFLLGHIYAERSIPDDGALYQTRVEDVEKSSRYYQRVIALSPRYFNSHFAVSPYTMLTALWGSLAARYTWENKEDSTKWAFNQGRSTGGYSPTMLEFARNVFKSCDSAAILLSEGDAITYPLNYLQCVEGYRRDVSVVRLFLLNAPWYAKSLKNPASSPHPSVHLSTTDSDIDSLAPIPFQRRNMTLPVPEQLLRSSGLADSIVSKGNITWEMNPTLSYDSLTGIRVQDILAFDIVHSNAWKRPIYFVATTDPSDRLGLDAYLQQSGLTRKLTPIREESIEGNCDYARLSRALLPGGNSETQSYQWQNFRKPQARLDTHVTNYLVQWARNAFLVLAWHELTVRRNRSLAMRAVDFMEKELPNSVYPLDPNLDIQVGDILYYSENYSKAIELYQRAITKQDNLASAYYKKGKAYFHSGNTELAVIAYEQAIELNPRETDSFAYPPSAIGPKARKIAEPKYPAIALRAGLRGVVKVAVLVDSKGVVRATRIIESSHQVFNEASLIAAQESTFEPGRLGHRTIPFWISIPFNFRVKGL